MQIVLDENDDPLKVSIDVKQIKQVIFNMVKNAMDAIEEVGEEHTGLIRRLTATENKFVHISIADNGHGMDHNTLVRLFDPFFTTKESGTGLGLSVSYRIIKNHGGTISVDSKKGEGTRFIIMLPLVYCSKRGVEELAICQLLCFMLPITVIVSNECEYISSITEG